MIKYIISKLKIWRLSLEILQVKEEIREHFIQLESRKERFGMELDVDRIHQQFKNLKLKEVRELESKIRQLK